MIEAEYTITYADYKSALRLYYRRRPSSVLGLFVIYGLTAFFVVMLAWGIWVRMNAGMSGYFATNGWLAYNAIFAAFFPVVRMVQLRRCFRAMFPEGSQRIIRLSANDEQLIFAVPGMAEGRYFWNAFRNFAENKNGMILFVNKRRFLIIPHHALNDAQWIEFRGLLNARMKSSQPVT